jgi:putative tricarboxylic transport membrane protein
LFAQITLLSDNTNRNPILFAAISILLPIAIDALFVFVIKMPLPKGIIGF